MVNSKNPLDRRASNWMHKGRSNILNPRHRAYRKPIPIFGRCTYPMPVMESVGVEIEEEVETGEFIYGVRYTELAMAILSVISA
jgi:hypothetical protein